ncbi:hypothetical protein C8A00DRAFT_41815 [Chaetomidium leptoderma]|uniref:Large ribosomal subunit protein mL50 n=1 Tax=Chaetomidium leptoderma TaxID=669021 RepID=A0AAN6ZXH9_9PEZI|nr:hypothetical protein C8A00DRAFT_41815 [Chaetomidium leptoderma]
MRRLSRVRSPASAGLTPSSIPSGALRASAAAALSPTASRQTGYNVPPARQQSTGRRYLSTTPLRASPPQSRTEAIAEEVEEALDEYYPRAEIYTPLVYPNGTTVAPAPASVMDATYTPADTAEGLEEVGGLAGWWDEPSHWGSEAGANQYVRSVVRPFGPAERVTDPAMLEVLAKRAIVEALVVNKFAGAEKRKAVDRLFASAGGTDRLGKIVGVEVVAGENGTATLKDKQNWQRVWDVLKSAVKMARPQQPGGKKADGEVAAVEAEAEEAEVPEVEVREAAPALQLTPQVAKSLIGAWNKDWKKAELRDPVVKYFAAKRIQQLTGHRIPDGKLFATTTIDSLLKHLVEPPKPKKLAELIETKDVFKDLANVRVFPRRVTPIDKEKMVGRWKIIVKELEERDLPIIGTGHHSATVEKKWVEGSMVAAVLGSQYGGASDRTAQLKEVVAALRVEIESDDGLAVIVEKLADGARDASWRLPLGDSGILEHVLSCVPLKKEAQHPMNKQALRLVGNACADCDENRARVAGSGALRSFVMDIMADPEEDALLLFAIAAALNIYAEPKVANPNTPALLLGLATSEKYDADLDTFMEICTPALAYLTFQDLQPVLLECGGIELLQLAFHQLYTRFDTSELDSDTTKQLKQVGDAFLTTLIDWLGSPTFSHLHAAACLSLGNLSRSDESSTTLLKHVQGPLVSILSRAIPPTPSEPPVPKGPAPPLQVTHAALSFLKNLAIAQVNKPILGAALLDPSNPLLAQLWTTTRTQPQLQFTAVSLTRLLLVNCPANVRHICTPRTDDDESNSTLALLVSTAASADEEPIKMEAARAASLVCRALHSSSSPPTATATATSNKILDESWTWTSSSSSQPPPPTANTEPAPDSVLTRFYTAHTPTITRSLAHLLTQPRFPTVRSDTIFVLALMSRSPEGAPMALQVLQSSSTEGVSEGAAWQALASIITGEEQSLDELAEGEDDDKVAELNKDKEGEEGGGGGVTVERLSLEPQQMDVQGQKQQPARAARMDRENGMVLVAELLGRFPDELSGLKRALEAILSKGGELVVQDREQEQK